MGERLDLFYEENAKVALFEEAVKEFKMSARNLQYAYNHARSFHKFSGIPFHESVEPILSLVERFCILGDRLYSLRKMSSSTAFKKLVDGFKDNYVCSRLNDEDIIDLNSSPETISRAMKDVAKRLNVAARMMRESFPSESKEVISEMEDIVELIFEEYVI